MAEKAPKTATVNNPILNLSSKRKIAEPLKADVVEIAKPIVENENPYLKMLYKMYEQDGVSKAMVDKILRQESS